MYGAVPRIGVAGEEAGLLEKAVLRARADLDRVRRLFGLIARLAREAWAVFGLRTIACTGTRLAGTGAQLASILLLTAYLDRVLDDAVLVLPLAGELPARADLAIYGAGAIIVGLFALSGVLNYLYGRWSWRLAGAFELHLIRRAAYTLSAMPLWRRSVDGVPLTPSAVRKIIGSDCRRAQFGFRHLLEGAVEPVAIAAWIGAMAWLNPRLTALIVPVALVTLPFVTQINRRASSMTRDLEEIQVLSAPERQLINHRLRHRLIDPRRDDPWLEQCLGAGYIAAGARTFGARQVVTEESKAVFTLAFSSLLLLVVLVGGGAALRDEMTWGALVAYLLLMRALLGQAVSLGSTVTYFSRFYPILSRYFAVVDGAAAATREAATEAPPAAEAAVTLRARSVDGHATTIALRTGERIGVMTRLAADRQLVPALCANTADQSLGALFGRVAFVNGGLRGRNIAAGLPTLDDGVADAVTRLLTEAGLDDVAAAFHRADRDRLFEPDEAADLPRSLSPAVLLALAALSDVPTVVVDASAALKIPEAPREHLLGRLSDRLVLFVYPMGPPFGRLFVFDEKALLVQPSEGLDLYVVKANQWPGSKRRLSSLLRSQKDQASVVVGEEGDPELEACDV